jgi:hypothetical protein
MLVSNLEVSGSIKMHGGGITGSLLGTASFTISSSQAISASYLIGFPETSSYAETASYAVTASFLEFSTSSVTVLNLTGSLTVSGTLDVTGSTSITGSLEVSDYIATSQLSASFVSASTVRATSFTGSYTGSLRGEFTGSGRFSGSFTGSARGEFSGSGANLFDISASAIVGLNLARISSGSVTASVSPVEGFVVEAIRSTITGSLTVTGTVSGSFSGSGANLYDISASAINGLDLGGLASGSVTASVDSTNGFIVKSAESGSIFTGSIEVTDGFFIGSGAGLTDVPPGNKLESGSVTASIYYHTSGSSSFQVNATVVATGSIYAGYESGSGLTSGTNIFGTASWASNSILFNGRGLGSFINTGSTNSTQAITGSLVITQNLTVQGSSSFTYVTASQILIDQNTLTVFGSGSTLPTAGYKVADTSSWDGTGSFLDESSLLYNLVTNEWTFANSLIVSGNLQVSHSVTASAFVGRLEGTASYVSGSSVDGTVSSSFTASYVTALTQSLIVSGTVESGSLFVEGATTITGSLTVISGSIRVLSGSITGSLLGTASYALMALTASYALNGGTGGGGSETASYAIEAASKRFVTESAYYAIHTGHVALMTRVYNNGTYSINEGKGIYAIGTQSIYDHGRLEVEQFFNKGIVINAGDLEIVPAVNESAGGGGGSNVSASYALTASYAENTNFVLNTGSLITTGSQGVTQTVRGTLSTTGSLIVAGATAAGGNTFSNTTTFNSAGNPISIFAGTLTSASVGENTRKSLVMNYGSSNGFILSNIAFNNSSSATLAATFNSVRFTVRTGSLHVGINATTASLLVSGNLPLEVQTTAIFSGSQSTHSLQINNGPYLTADRVGDTDNLRIIGSSHPLSGSIVFGPSGSNIIESGIFTSRSFTSLIGGADSLFMRAKSVQLGVFNTPSFEIDELGNITTGRPGSSTGINESVGSNQYVFQHIGIGSNLVVKHRDSNPGNFWRIQNAFSTGLFDRLQIITNQGVGVYLSSGSTSWTAVSDERSKDILYPIENAVEKVEGLRTVIGKYKTDGDQERRAFFIAQDMQEVFPEAVEASDPSELGINYTEVSPLLAAAIKELSQENKQLRRELDEVKLILSRISQ